MGCIWCGWIIRAIVTPGDHRGVGRDVMEFVAAAYERPRYPKPIGVYCLGPLPLAQQCCARPGMTLELKIDKGNASGIDGLAQEYLAQMGKAAGRVGGQEQRRARATVFQ